MGKQGYGWCGYHKCWHDASAFTRALESPSGLQSYCTAARSAMARCNGSSARKRLKLKLTVLTHYAGGSPKCVRCGYSDLRALTLDHINGGGAAHRREVTGGGTGVYNWAKRNSYPPIFQVLCQNCNSIKAIENKETGRKPVLPDYVKPTLKQPAPKPQTCFDTDIGDVQ